MTPRTCKFIAIAVAQGDAFFLERDCRTVLVDGGASARNFLRQFARATGRCKVDIVVCTHNDADHAGGLIGFLRSGQRCKEVWLPASWRARLGDLLSFPVDFADELLHNVVEHVKAEGDASLEILGERLSETGPTVELDGGGDAGADMNDLLLVEVLRDRTPEPQAYETVWPCSACYPCASGPYPWCFLRMKLPANGPEIRLFWEAIKAAGRIREIALAASRMSARIRWFEYNNRTAAGGDPGFLVPVNAVETTRKHSTSLNALHYLALTTANSESLVLAAPPSEREPGVLFTSDSALQFCQTIPWGSGSLITSPHHGSNDNANAYRRFSRECGNKVGTTWVRSDGKFRGRPGSCYLKSPGAHFCTRCRPYNEGEQDVRLEVQGGQWLPVGGTTGCTCQ